MMNERNHVYNFLSWPANRLRQSMTTEKAFYSTGVSSIRNRVSVEEGPRVSLPAKVGYQYLTKL